MAEVFAGFVCGYALAVIGVPVLALGLARLRTSSALVARLFPSEAPLVALVVVLHGALIVVCTGAGLILGLLLYAMRDSGGALGSLNIAFTLLVFGFTLAILAPAAIVFSRYRLQALAIAAAILLLFGWLMPYMAEWSNFDSS